MREEAEEQQPEIPAGDENVVEELRSEQSTEAKLYSEWKSK